MEPSTRGGPGGEDLADGEQPSYELDLTGESPAEPKTLDLTTDGQDEASTLGVDKPQLGFDESKHHAESARLVAVWLLATLASLVTAGIVLFACTRWTKLAPADVKSFFEVVFGPIVTLVGAATGFYFGTHSEQPRRENASSRRR